ncbi:hypothetical protein [Nocardia sp. IFM 10818]
MNSDPHTGSAGRIEQQLLGVNYEVRWSPADSAYLAFSGDFPELINTDPCSSLAALDGLEEMIRRALHAGPDRLLCSTSSEKR